MKTNAHRKLGNHGSPNPSSKGNRTHENTSNDNELDLTTCRHRLVSVSQDLFDPEYSVDDTDDGTSNNVAVHSDSPK